MNSAFSVSFIISIFSKGDFSHNTFGYHILVVVHLGKISTSWHRTWNLFIHTVSNLAIVFGSNLYLEEMPGSSKNKLRIDATCN